MEKVAQHPRPFREYEACPMSLPDETGTRGRSTIFR